MIATFFLSGHKRKYPSGPRYPMTPEWKALVEAKLKERGMTRADLADAVGVSRGAITQILGPKQTSSALVPAVCRALDVAMPLLSDVDEFMSIVAELQPNQQRVLLDLAREFRKKPA